jgi:GTP cyclohydrolase II
MKAAAEIGILCRVATGRIRTRWGMFNAAGFELATKGSAQIDTAKLKAYELQDDGIDTVEANHVLGFRTDYRDYSLPVAILHELGVNRVRLLTNNPAKARALADAGIKVARIPCEAKEIPYSLPYLRTKKEKMDHALSLRDGSGQIKDLRVLEAANPHALHWI